VCCYRETDAIFDGYVELAYAVKSKLAYGWVKNQTGNFVKANSNR